MRTGSNTTPAVRRWNREAPLGRLLLLGIMLASPLPAQQLSGPERSAVDSSVRAVLRETGAPSASIAVVRDGAIAYEQAYGAARAGTGGAAPSMRYAIGSVSKQFTATAILLLAEDGKLSLDDKVATWFPDLTRAADIDLRHLLSMTSGYQDYWPQDYVFSDMQRRTTSEAIMRRWAGKPLDFEPGTRWQYSNTNYVIAAAIVERVAGMPFMAFLQERIFTPLGMASVVDFDAGPLDSGAAGPYLRHALGPLRPAPKEAPGWLFGAGQLAMTAHDLALWNIAVIDRALLRPESYRVQQREVLLDAGNGTGYGLGVSIGTWGDRRRISHGGAVSGYTTTNQVFPDDRAAIVVFTNIYPGAAGAPGMIAAGIADVLFAESQAVDVEAWDLARRVYDDLVKGRIDRRLLTPSANAYFTEGVLADYASSLAPLGQPTEFQPGGQRLRGGMTIRTYRIHAGGISMQLTTMTLPDGRIDQYVIQRAG